ncbi:FtsH protease activity modulator HflK [Cochlodiniinecator piscidefendens]|uniref:FtsH protease activity modulator HflK n=1 Tax=Cochlodiniinecator piscidefendens TaxID=2715756 RepID=UPI00140DDD0D|nr:FtsH protease activity modulator HflK [Cochlodiniinecator piscidefendens]
MSGNSGGPWGGGGSGGGNRGNDDNNNDGGRRPSSDDGPQIPEIDEIVKKGQEQLRVLMGGGGNGTRRPNGGSGPDGPGLTKGTLVLGALAAAALWTFASFYSVKPEERSVELFLGEFYAVGEPGLNFAPWPVVSRQIVEVTTERVETIGTGSQAGLMLTGDENIVDIDFQVVWNVSDPVKYLFTLRDPSATVSAVSESAMREIIAQSELAPILNRDRGLISETLQELVQNTLDEYESGINIVRVTLDRAEPPSTPVRTEAPVSVEAAFREVQDAAQTRERLENQADAYANEKLAGARGERAQLLEAAEGYRARVVNLAEGEASRFGAILTEYLAAPEVTRRRLYLETMEEVLGGLDKIILDSDTTGGGQGVVPYLPLNELRRNGGSN